MMWMKEGYKPLDGEERIRVERLLSEMGMERKLNIYCNRDARTNAVTFGVPYNRADRRHSSDGIGRGTQRGNQP